MKTLCAEDGDRIKDNLISYFKYCIFFEILFWGGRKKKRIEDMANGRKGMEISSTKIWKINFVISVHSSSQGLFVFDTWRDWHMKMDVQHKDFLQWNQVMVGFYK